MLSRSFVVTLTLITTLTLIGCGGGGGKTPLPPVEKVPPVEKGYARITINWWNMPSDTSTLRGRYIPTSVDKITVIIHDTNNNVAGSGIIQRPNSEIVIELPVGNNYVAKASGYDRNNNLIGEGISDPFNISPSTTTDVRITITGINEPQNNNQSGAILLTFSNNQATGREIFHTPKDSIDWFRFTSRNDKAYTVHFSVLEATADSNNWRIKMSVYDGNTLVKEASSPSNAVPPAPVTISKPASGTVYVKVEVVSGTFKGWYQVDAYQLDLGSAKVVVD
jgi:predicted small lipoprotein YifL